MKLLLLISVATLTVLLKFDYVSSKNKGEKENELLAVLVGEYEEENETTINKGYNAEKFDYTNFPNAKLGKATVLQTSSTKKNIDDSVFEIILTQGQYTLKQWSRKSGLGKKKWADVTNDDLQHNPECDIKLSRNDQGSFEGTTDNCNRYEPGEEKPEKFSVTLNCTHFITEGTSGLICLRKKYSYRLPSHLTVEHPPCPNAPKPSK